MGLGAAEVLLVSQWLAPSRRILENVRQFGNDVRVLRQGIELLEREQFDSPRLASLRGVVSDTHAVAALRKLERLVNAVFECNKEMFYLPSWLLLLPVQLALGIEGWKSRHASELRHWADAWSEFEALNSLACYAYEHPDYVFPQIDRSTAAIRVEGLAHPLLAHDGCVANDVELGGERRFYLISGSNMAGKSTLLRSIGLAAVLGGAGAPVRAREASMACLSVCASIGVSDSLSEGKSRFLAEVEKIREALRAGGDDRPVLFLFDELFSGTNSTDRRIAAEAVIRELVSAGAIGAVSTHDLTLAEIAELPELRVRTSIWPAVLTTIRFRLITN